MFCTSNYLLLQILEDLPMNPVVGKYATLQKKMTKTSKHFKIYPYLFIDAVFESWLQMPKIADSCIECKITVSFDQSLPGKGVNYNKEKNKGSKDYSFIEISSQSIVDVDILSKVHTQCHILGVCFVHQKILQRFRLYIFFPRNCFITWSQEKMILTPKHLFNKILWSKQF